MSAIRLRVYVKGNSGFAIGDDFDWDVPFEAELTHPKGATIDGEQLLAAGGEYFYHEVKYCFNLSELSVIEIWEAPDAQHVPCNTRL